MRFQPLFRLSSTVLLIGLVSLATVSAAPPRRGPKEGEVPFFCSTQAWNDPFEVVSTRYEKAGNQIIWTLKAKKDIRVASYYAFLGDGDNVELATRSVKFTPDRANAKAGTQLQAVVSLGSLSPREVGNLTIRQRR
jgi:hypothetical protein